MLLPMPASEEKDEEGMKVKAAEDDALLLSVVTCGTSAAAPYSNSTFLLLLLQANDMKTEVARVAAPLAMPLGFHGLITAGEKGKMEGQGEEQRFEYA